MSDNGQLSLFYSKKEYKDYGSLMFWIGVVTGALTGFFGLTVWGMIYLS